MGCRFAVACRSQPEALDDLRDKRMDQPVPGRMDRRGASQGRGLDSPAENAGCKLPQFVSHRTIHTYRFAGVKPEGVESCALLYGTVRQKPDPVPVWREPVILGGRPGRKSLKLIQIIHDLLVLSRGLLLNERKTAQALSDLLPGVTDGYLLVRLGWHRTPTIDIHGWFLTFRHRQAQANQLAFSVDKGKGGDSSLL